MSEAPDSVRSCDPLIGMAVRPLSDNSELQLVAAVASDVNPWIYTMVQSCKFPNRPLDW